jgi:hypothetical protein
MPGYMGSGITVGASWRLSLALQPRGFVIQLVGECEELAIGLMAARRTYSRHSLVHASLTPEIGCPAH